MIISTENVKKNIEYIQNALFIQTVSDGGESSVIWIPTDEIREDDAVDGTENLLCW